MLSRIQGHIDATDVKAMVGSGFLWAWFDALFMSAFFSMRETTSLFAEGAAMAMDGMSVLFFIVMMLPIFGKRLERVASSNRAILTVGVVGTAGSLAFVAAGHTGNVGLLLLGGLATGAYAAIYQIIWGAVYSRNGSTGAVTCVSGAFACAVLFDIPLLFMVERASSVFYALFPLASGLVLSCVDVASRRYSASASPLPERPGGVRAKVHAYLGVSMLTVGGMAFVMVGFGYMQHLISFSSAPQDGVSWGILVQVVRGITAIVLFAGVVLAPQKAPAVYRTGLLVMVAGFMVMPFFWDTDLFWIPGAIVISGYTVFDAMVWAVIAQTARTQSLHPQKTVAFMRALAAGCYVLGACVGIVFMGKEGVLRDYAAQETNLVGYLVVVAIAFLLSSEDVWILFSGFWRENRAGREDVGDVALTGGQEDGTDGYSGLVLVRLDMLGLTAREREIAVLLAHGRTQPWIAEFLGVSGSTVGTHLRHIYQKAGVHNRQEFIDVVSSPLEG